MRLGQILGLLVGTSLLGTGAYKSYQGGTVQISQGGSLVGPSNPLYVSSATTFNQANSGEGTTAIAAPNTVYTLSVSGGTVTSPRCTWVTDDGSYDVYVSNVAAGTHQIRVAAGTSYPVPYVGLTLYVFSESGSGFNVYASQGG